jgi:hypothetical protein
MAYDTGFSRRSSSERDLQPVAIISVDPISRTAVAVTRTRHNLTINTAYATGDTITVPASGEQWYIERFDGEWRLYGRIPFNDETLNIKPEEGQVSVGSARGPLELNGPEVRFNSKVFRLNGVYYRDSGTALERSTDQVTWGAVSAATATTLAQDLAASLAGYQGTDETGALSALKDWSGLVQTIVDNFSEFWNVLCQNVFIGGLKDLGFGDTDLSKTVNGLQNFLNYLFGVVFCDFDGNLTPQTVLARLRDLLSPIISNPFITGLQGIATALGVNVGNLLNDVVAGLTGLIELVWNIVTCQWDQLDLTGLQAIIDIFTNGTGDFGPAAIINFLKTIFLDPIFSNLATGTLTPIIGTFLNGLKQVADLITGALTGQQFDSLLEGVVQGVQDFVQLIYDTVTEILGGSPLTRLPDIAAIIALITEGASAFSPANIVRSVTDFFTLFGSPTFINDGVDTGIPNPVGIFFTALGDFWQAIIGLIPGATDGGLFKNAINAVAEMFSILQSLIFVNPFDAESLDGFNAAVAKVEAAFASTLAAAGVPAQILNVLKTILNSLINNPLVKIAQEIFTYLGTGLTGTNLLGQIVDGSEQVFNLLMKIITDVLIPLDDTAWNTLLPFIPAAVWVNIRATALPDFGVNFLGGLGPLLKVIFEALETFLGLDPDNISNFFKNILVFFGDTVSHFFTLLFTDQTEAIKYFLVDVLGIAEDIGGGVLNFVSSFIGNAGDVLTDLLTKLLSVFGIDFDPRDENGDPVEFNAATALTAFVNKFLTTGLGGVIGTTVTELTRFFTRLKNLFGLADFFTSGTFDFAAAATGFINNVLYYAPTAAVSTLQGIIETATSLVYKLAQAVITAIRGIPFVGTGIADFLQTQLNNFVNFSRFGVRSGTNLISDPGGEIATFWTAVDSSNVRIQPNVEQNTNTAYRRSGSTSLTITSDGASPRWFFWNVNDLGVITPITTEPGEVFSASCWVLYPVTVSGVANPGASGTVTVFAQFYSSTGAVALQTYYADKAVTQNNTTWVQVSGGFTVPAGYDRVSFGFMLRNNYTTSGAKFYVDDMLVRETTAVQNVTDATVQAVVGGTGTGYTPADVTTALGGVNNMAQGYTQSGTNLLADPKIDYPAFWVGSATGLTTSTTYYNSSARSLELTANGSSISFDWTVNNNHAVAPVSAYAGRIFYVECTTFTPTSQTATVALRARGYSFKTRAYGSALTAKTFTAAGTWSAVSTPNPYTAGTTANNGLWTNKLYGYFTVPVGYDGFTAGITVTSASTTAKFYFDDLAIYDVTESVNTNERLYNRPTPATAIITDAIPTGIPAANVAGLTGVGSISATVDGLNTTVNTAGTGLVAKTSALDSTVNTAGTGLVAKTSALDSTVNTAGTGLKAVSDGTNTALWGTTTNGTTFLASKLSTLISSLSTIKADGTDPMSTLLNNITTSLSKNTYTTSTVAGVKLATDKARTDADTSALRINATNTLLYGADAGGNGGKILLTALPDSLSTVGSGAIIARQNPGSNYPINATGQTTLASFFNQPIRVTPDITMPTGSYGGYNWYTAEFIVSKAGWYGCEIGLRLANPYAGGNYNFTPIIYKKPSGGVSAVHRYGTEIIGLQTATGTRKARFANSSWILYLAAGDSVQAGYDAGLIDGDGTQRLNFFTQDNTGNDSYFAISLLNL